MAAEQNKVYLPVDGRAVIDRSLEVLDRADAVTSIVMVIRPDDRALGEAAIERVVERTAVTVVHGGVTRTASELAGLAVVERRPGPERPDLVMIHDAARPFLTIGLLERLVDAAVEHGGAVPGVEMNEPVVVDADGSGPRRPPEGRLVRVQTPQVFATAPLLAAYADLDPETSSVDTAHVVELHGGVVVQVVASDDRNLKVTRPADLDRADELAATWDAGRWITS